MTTKEKNEYRSLPGRGYASEGPIAVARVRSRLYLGKDHLLRVSTSWVENYRRFYFNDIEAVIVSRTNRGLVWNIILAVLCAGFLFWYVEMTDHTGRIILACTVAFFGLFLLINVLYGQTCRVRIYTRVGCEPLPSIRRLRIANKVLALLKPEITAVQGELETSKVPQQLANWQSSSTGSKRRESASRTNNYRGALHGWLFAMLLAEAGMIAAFIFSPAAITGMGVLFFVFLVSGLTLVSLARQAASVLGSGLRGVTWWTLAHVALNLITGYCLMVFTVIRNPKISGDQYALFGAIARLPIRQTPWLLGASGFTAGFAAILGVTGLIIWLNSRTAIANAAAEDSVPS